MTDPYFSPLRYPGGKGKISPFIFKVFEQNLLSDGCYVEPYAGGASVALSLLFNEYCSKIIINDLDRSIYAFWYSILNSPDEFCRRVRDCKVSVSNWYRQRAIQKRKSEEDLFDLGFSTFFLNRANRSGIISAGIIGGKEQTGAWKIDARFNKKSLIERIEKIADFKDRIFLYNLDAVDFIEDKVSKLSSKTLVYIDPPYYDRGKELYVNFYNHDDHVKISKVISKIKSQKWVVSYDNKKEIRDLYSNFRSSEYSLNYSAGKASQGNEVMFFSDNLYVPDIPIMTKIVA